MKKPVGDFLPQALLFAGEKYHDPQFFERKASIAPSPVVFYISLSVPGMTAFEKESKYRSVTVFYIFRLLSPARRSV
ncbi:MAG: hypothetical protein J5738_05430 [Lachnospiraceae bacterium]|nr:hypothetical protein [Lachnospiraceae bacterium]